MVYGGGAACFDKGNLLLPRSYSTHQIPFATVSLRRRHGVRLNPGVRRCRRAYLPRNAYGRLVVGSAGKVLMIGYCRMPTAAVGSWQQAIQSGNHFTGSFPGTAQGRRSLWQGRRNTKIAQGGGSTPGSGRHP